MSGAYSTHIFVQNWSQLALKHIFLLNMISNFWLYIFNDQFSNLHILPLFTARICTVKTHLRKIILSVIICMKIITGLIQTSLTVKFCKLPWITDGLVDKLEGLVDILDSAVWTSDLTDSFENLLSSLDGNKLVET